LSTRGLPWIEIDFPEDYQRAVNEVLPKIESLAGAWSSSIQSLRPAVTTFDEP